MRSLLLLLCASACSKSTGDYEKACNHLQDLAIADVETNIATLKQSGADADLVRQGEALKRELIAGRAADLPSCVAKSQKLGLDPACYLAATTSGEAQACTLRNLQK